MQRLLRHLLFALVFAVTVAVTHACDLCGSYTPQIEATPKSELSTIGQTAPSDAADGGWLSHVYVAISLHSPSDPASWYHTTSSAPSYRSPSTTPPFKPFVITAFENASR
jgi:hypothetical protein